MGSKAENWAPVETMTRAQEFLCEVIKVLFFAPHTQFSHLIHASYVGFLALPCNY